MRFSVDPQNSPLSFFGKTTEKMSDLNLHLHVQVQCTSHCPTMVILPIQSTFATPFHVFMLFVVDIPVRSKPLEMSQFVLPSHKL